MVVLKFGGKSLSNKQKVANVCKYIKSRAEQCKVVVVVSAFGYVTDKLIKQMNSFGVQANNLREQDAYISTGETQSSAIVASLLCNMQVPAVSVQGWQIELNTMGEHGSSIVTSINKTKLQEKFESYNVVVVAGFQGVNSNGDVTTLGRGGSDTTAVALGAVLNCEVEIFSDYDGVFMGDPKEAPFKKIDNIDYVSMQALSNSGAKVLSNTCVDIARQAKVKVKCKASNSPNNCGTHLSNVPNPFIGITCKSDLCEINVISNSEQNNLQKTAKYIMENVKYYKIFINTNKISLFVSKDCKKQVIMQIAKFNNLLNTDNV